MVWGLENVLEKGRFAASLYIVVSNHLTLLQSKQFKLIPRIRIAKLQASALSGASARVLVLGHGTPLTLFQSQ